MEIGRNCQDFCKEFSSVLGLKQLETDVETTARVVAEKVEELLNAIWN